MLTFLHAISLVLTVFGVLFGGLGYVVATGGVVLGICVFVRQQRQSRPYVKPVQPRDWVQLSGGGFELVVPRSEHRKGRHPITELREGDTSTGHEVVIGGTSIARDVVAPLAQMKTKTITELIDAAELPPAVVIHGGRKPHRTTLVHKRAFLEWCSQLMTLRKIQAQFRLSSRKLQQALEHRPCAPLRLPYDERHYYPRVQIERLLFRSESILKL